MLLPETPLEDAAQSFLLQAGAAVGSYNQWGDLSQVEGIKWDDAKRCHTKYILTEELILAAMDALNGQNKV